MDEARFEALTAAAVNVVYCVALAGLLLMAFPGVRESLVRTWTAQLYAWRHGRWLAGRRPVAEWTTLLAREDLPQELA